MCTGRPKCFRVIMKNNQMKIIMLHAKCFLKSLCIFANIDALSETTSGVGNLSSSWILCLWAVVAGICVTKHLDYIPLAQNLCNCWWSGTMLWHAWVTKMTNLLRCYDKRSILCCLGLWSRDMREYIECGISANHTQAAMQVRTNLSDCHRAYLCNSSTILLY